VRWQLPNWNRKPRFFVRTVENQNRGFLEPSEDGFTVWNLYLYSVKLHEQTDGQRRTNVHGNVHRDRRRHTVSTSDVAATCGLCQEKRTNERESNLVHFSLKMWHLGAKMLTNFLMINWPNFVYLLVDPGIYPPPLNFCEASRFVSPIGWTPLTDGVWHIRYKANELIQWRKLKVPKSSSQLNFPI